MIDGFVLRALTHNLTSPVDNGRRVLNRLMISLAEAVPHSDLKGVRDVASGCVGTRRAARRNNLGDSALYSGR